MQQYSFWEINTLKSGLEIFSSLVSSSWIAYYILTTTNLLPPPLPPLQCPQQQTKTPPNPPPKTPTTTQPTPVHRTSTLRNAIAQGRRSRRGVSLRIRWLVWGMRGWLRRVGFRRRSRNRLVSVEGWVVGALWGGMGEEANGFRIFGGYVFWDIWSFGIHVFCVGLGLTFGFWVFLGLIDLRTFSLGIKMN